jgi:hypothetical protein
MQWVEEYGLGKHPAQCAWFWDIQSDIVRDWFVDFYFEEAAMAVLFKTQFY